MEKGFSVTAYKRGLQGEAIAISFLKLNGYDILYQRYKTSYGEIDIIALLGEMLVCIEVKTRATSKLSLHAIHRKQKERIMQAYLYFIQANPRYMNHPVRFDVIVCAPNSKPYHVKHAFESDYE